MKLTSIGVTRKLYAETRNVDFEKSYLEDFIKLAVGGF